MELRPFENLSLENMKNEVWLDVLGYENIYQISNMGRIKTKHRIMEYDRCLGRGIEKKTIYPRIRKQKINKHTGYLVIGLNSKGKSQNYTVHSIVGEAFLNYKRGQGRTKTGNSVNHIDGDKFNNNISNLEVISLGDNVRHAFKTGLIKTSHKVSYKGIEYYSKAEFRRKTGCPEKKMQKMIKQGEIKLIK